MRFVNCTIFIVSALLILRACLNLSLIVDVERALYDLFVQLGQEIQAHFRSNRQMASYIM